MVERTAESGLKGEVREFWNRVPCGQVYAQGASRVEQLEAQARARYELEPYLKPFARFQDATGRDVLEIGVGMGADHVELARSSPRSLTGVDLTPRAIALTEERLAMYGLPSDLRVADAEALPFADESFDLVYSYGVLHHSPDTQRAVREVWRVLRPGGTARVMIYHKWSIVGAMLWTRYALLAGRPLRGLSDVYAQHLESPGTKAYSVAGALSMFSQFFQVNARTELSAGDLLQGAVGQRHGGGALTWAKRLWPRALIKRALPRWGLCLFIEARK